VAAEAGMGENQFACGLFVGGRKFNPTLTPLISAGPAS